MTARTAATRSIFFAAVMLATTVMLASTSISLGQSPRLLRTLKLQDLRYEQIPVITAVAIHPTQDWIATAGDDHLIRIWSLQSGEVLHVLRGHVDWISTLAFASDGRTLLSSGRDHQIRLWDAREGQPAGVLLDPGHAVASIVISPTRPLAAIVGFQTPLKIVDLLERKVVAEYNCPCGDMRAVQFSPDGKWIAAGGRNGKLRLWDLEDGTSVDIPAHKRRIRNLCFTRDGHRLITVGEDQAIAIWNPATKHLVERIPNAGGKLLSLALVNEDQLAAAGADNVIRIFSLASRRPAVELAGHTGSIATLAVRDEHLISGSFDTTVRIWSLPAGPITSIPDTRTQPASTSIDEPTR